MLKYYEYNYYVQCIPSVFVNLRICIISNYKQFLVPESSSLLHIIINTRALILLCIQTIQVKKALGKSLPGDDSCDNLIIGSLITLFAGDDFGHCLDIGG